MAELVLPKNSKVKDGKKYHLDSDSKNKKSFKVYRWDPEKNDNLKKQKFVAEYHGHPVVGFSQDIEI